jgi:hypothetical protein
LNFELCILNWRAPTSPAPSNNILPKRQERGVYAASAFANAQTNAFAIARKTLKRPEGRAPLQLPTHLFLVSHAKP